MRDARRSRRQALGLLLPLGGALLAACSGQQRTPAATSRWLAWPARNEWPAPFWQSAPEVQEAYRYAVANPGVLQYFPCYCGCVEDGHTSNKDCYLREVRPDGAVVLDPMSFG